MPPGCQFTRAAVNILNHVSVDQVFHMIAKGMTAQRRKVLGAAMITSEDILRLPTIREQEQFQYGVYYKLAARTRDLDGHYVGSATGENGVFGRWTDYDLAKAKHDGAPLDSMGFHLKYCLARDTTVHLRVLACWDQEALTRQQVLLVEALFMDFLGTIDRQQSSLLPYEQAVARSSHADGRGQMIFHSQEMLEASISAFPEHKRLDSSLRGLNHASAMRQVKSTKGSITRCVVGHELCEESLARSRGVFLGAGKVVEPTCIACYYDTQTSPTFDGTEESLHA